MTKPGVLQGAFNRTDISLPTDIRLGWNSLATLKGYAQEKQIQKALIVTDTGVKEAGVLQQPLDTLQSVNIEVFDRVKPEPTIESINSGISFAEKVDPDLIIGVGGGSSLDTAKLIAVLKSKEISVRSCLGMGNMPNSRLPLVLVGE